MENLESIKSRITDLVSEKENLENEKAEKERQLLETCKKNYNSIVLPVLKELVELDNFIEDKVNLEVSDSANNICKLNFSFDGVSYWMFYSPRKYVTNGVKLMTNNCVGSVNFTCADTFASYKSDILKGYTELLSTVEGATFFADKAKEHFSERFKVYEKHIDSQCSELKDTIKRLSETLSKSSTLKTSDDGNTIEITINGKKYVGKLEEK